MKVGPGCISDRMVRGSLSHEVTLEQRSKRNKGPICLFLLGNYIQYFVVAYGEKEYERNIYK